MGRFRNRDASVYADEEHIIITLDGRTPRGPEGERLHGQMALGDAPLRFSVTKGGNFKFSKKTKTTARVKKVPVLDDEGNPVPNPDYDPHRAHWGGDRGSEFKVERVLQEEPHVETSYDVDRDWWRRNSHTRVIF
jgi:hypothetical protein